MLKYIFLFILFVLLYRMIKTALIGTKKRNPVQGQAKSDKSVQQKNKKNIEDAEFEEIE